MNKMTELEKTLTIEKVKILHKEWGMSYKALADGIGVTASALKQFIYGNHGALGPEKQTALYNRVERFTL